MDETRTIDYREKWVDFECPNCKSTRALARFADGIHLETRCFGCNVLFIKGLKLEEIERAVEKAEEVSDISVFSR